MILRVLKMSWNEDKMTEETVFINSESSLKVDSLKPPVLVWGLKWETLKKKG